jgi:cytochrome bd ubiquinol oxidase subunit I
MIENIDLSLINWSRAQFALTAMYHWLFVPLTLGLSFIIAFMETMYYRTRDPEWRRITKFWMTLFGINFAIGVATGIILEFEFGTNWSNYSWFVGDIFGAPLAIEGIMAFFLESTFIAVMFFGWNKVSPKFHLVSTWLVAFGANLSALWILVANGWMQSPVGMHFNPDTARNEMLNFWDVLLSPTAVHKFLHTISSGFTLAAVFVIGISAWFLLKKRDALFAKRSMLIAAIFGLVASVFTAFTGDSSARTVAENQPMKFAAMEGLNEGSKGAPLTLFGFVKNSADSNVYAPEVFAKFEVPFLLSVMAHHNPDAFVPGIKDLIEGNAENDVLSAKEKIERGKVARNVLITYKESRKKGDENTAEVLKAQLNDTQFQQQYFRYFGYSFVDHPQSLIPHVPLTFYSFRIMVGLGFYFIVLFFLVLLFLYKGTIENKPKFLWLTILTIPLPYIAGQAGWIVAEVGRQPWVIQDYLPTAAAVSHINTSAVQVTFWLFFAVFTALLIAEISIMLKQIKLGANEEGGH